MQNYNSSFMVRLTIDRTCLLALFILVLAIISPLMAFDEARAQLVTFSDYPQGTPITDQYQDLGIIFSGEPQPPIIAPPDSIFGVDGPALFGFPLSPVWGSGSIIATFVDPIDGTPAEAVNFHLFYYLLYGNAVTFTFYDIYGGIISQQEANENNLQYVRLDR